MLRQYLKQNKLSESLGEGFSMAVELVILTQMDEVGASNDNVLV